MACVKARCSWVGAFFTDDLLSTFLDHADEDRMNLSKGASRGRLRLDKTLPSFANASAWCGYANQLRRRYDLTQDPVLKSFFLRCSFGEMV